MQKLQFMIQNTAVKHEWRYAVVFYKESHHWIKSGDYLQRIFQVQQTLQFQLEIKTSVALFKESCALLDI